MGFLGNAWNSVKSAGSSVVDKAEDLGSSAVHEAEDVGSSALHEAEDLGSAAVHEADDLGTAAVHDAEEAAPLAWNMVSGAGGMINVKSMEEHVTNGLHGAEDWVDDESHDLAGKLSDVPVLGSMANSAADTVTTDTQILGGFLGGATSFAGGLVNMAEHPLDSAAGLESVAEHAPDPMGLSRLLKAGHNALNVVEGKESLGDAVDHTLDPETVAKDDTKFDGNLVNGILEPYKQSWNDKRYGEVGGRAIFDIGSFLVGGGEENAAEKAGEAANEAERAAQVGEDAARGTEIGLDADRPAMNPPEPIPADRPAINPSSGNDVRVTPPAERPTITPGGIADEPTVVDPTPPDIGTRPTELPPGVSPKATSIVPPPPVERPPGVSPKAASIVPPAPVDPHAPTVVDPSPPDIGTRPTELPPGRSPNASSIVPPAPVDAHAPTEFDQHGPTEKAPAPGEHGAGHETEEPEHGPEEGGLELFELLHKIADLGHLGGAGHDASEQD